MSKHVNMTGHYKIAGRERQGEDIIQSSQKGAFAQQRQQVRRPIIHEQNLRPGQGGLGGWICLQKGFLLLNVGQ